MQDVAATGGLLDRRTLELRKILAGESEDGRGVAGLESNEVGSGRLVAVSWAPESEVGDSAEMDGSLDWLMGGAILTKADGVVCC